MSDWNNYYAYKYTSPGSGGRGGNGGLWCRPAAMWSETIERDGRKYQRFEKI